MVKSIPIHEASAPARPTVDQIWTWLREVMDPEIPVVSIVDLGIVRDISWSEEADACVVTVTPTYSGCPAIAVIQSHIRQELEQHGVPRIQLRIQISPAWTSDWLSPQARKSLHAYGIAPPTARSSETSAHILPVLGSGAPQPTPHCPHCGSPQTSLISQFGSTPCKALYRCNDCLEPFDSFKCH